MFLWEARGIHNEALPCDVEARRPASLSPRCHSSCCNERRLCVVVATWALRKVTTAQCAVANPVDKGHTVN